MGKYDGVYPIGPVVDLTGIRIMGKPSNRLNRMIAPRKPRWAKGQDLEPIRA